MDNQLLMGMLGVGLLAYCALHSWLASLRCKAWLAARWPQLQPSYRLVYNLVSVLLLLPLLGLILAYSGEPLWRWPGVWFWLAQAVGLAGLIGFLLSLRLYDLGDFLGLQAWRSGQVRGTEALHLSIFHRYVRHPWYCFGLLMLWTRELNAAELLAVVIVTLYLIVGSRLEEGKLIALYGDAYRRYCERVPGLLPWPWRYLSRSEAKSLEDEANQRLQAAQD